MDMDLSDTDTDTTRTVIRAAYWATLVMGFMYPRVIRRAYSSMVGRLALVVWVVLGAYMKWVAAPVMAGTVVVLAMHFPLSPFVDFMTNANPPPTPPTPTPPLPPSESIKSNETRVDREEALRAKQTICGES